MARVAADCARVLASYPLQVGVWGGRAHTRAQIADCHGSPTDSDR